MSCSRRAPPQPVPITTSLHGPAQPYAQVVRCCPVEACVPGKSVLQHAGLAPCM